MADFTVKGVAYQSRLLDGETQTLVMKRLLPTFTSLISIKDDLGAVSTEDDSGLTLRERMSQALMPVARELAAIPDRDVQFILEACLDVTSRQVAIGTGWVAVRQRGQVQDQNDTKFATRLMIAWHVLAENFGEMLTFFGVDLTALQGAAPALN